MKILLNPRFLHNGSGTIKERIVKLDSLFEVECPRCGGENKDGDYVGEPEGDIREVEIDDDGNPLWIFECPACKSEIRVTAKITNIVATVEKEEKEEKEKPKKKTSEDVLHSIEW